MNEEEHRTLLAKAARRAGLNEAAAEDLATRLARKPEMIKHLDEAEEALAAMTKFQRTELAAMLITVAVDWKDEYGYAYGKVLAELAMWIKAY